MINSAVAAGGASAGRFVGESAKTLLSVEILARCLHRTPVFSAPDQEDPAANPFPPNAERPYCVSIGLAPLPVPPSKGSNVQFAEFMIIVLAVMLILLAETFVVEL